MTVVNPRIEHLAPLIAEGRLMLVSGPSVALMFDTIQSLPWFVTTVDWTKMADPIVVSLWLGEDQILRQISKTEFGRHDYALAFFSPDRDVVG
jgi:hypothetical protein